MQGAATSCTDQTSGGGASFPPLPSLQLDVAELPPLQRVEAWRASFARFYELPTASSDLRASGSILRLGDTVLTDTVQPKHFVREAAAARRDGGDAILISVDFSGFAMETADGSTHVDAGRVTLFDLARPVSTRGAAGRTLVLGVPREAVERVLPGCDLHGVTLDRGELVVEHMQSLRRHLPQVASSAAPHLVRSTVELVAACLAASPQRVEAAAPALAAALLGRAKRYVRLHSHDPKLSPGAIALALGVSRSSLYRAFEAEGGIAEWIRDCRLAASRAALEDISDGRRIGEIAFTFGFSSEAQFSRAVRSAFGASPRELRHAALVQGAESPA